MRFFAQARDAAGCREAEFGGPTVGAVLDAAFGAFGETLRAVVASSAIWVNGESADRDQPVTAGDEIAVLPPVSGG